MRHISHASFDSFPPARHKRPARDFLGFHHRWVRARGTVKPSRVCRLARWPSRKAAQHARDRIRQITDRKRLLLPDEWILQELNQFLRGWGGYFRYGNSARMFDAISQYALERLAGFVGPGRHLVRPGRALLNTGDGNLTTVTVPAAKRRD